MYSDLLKTPSKDTVIWHYFSLSKFLSLLNDSCLYFSRYDQLFDSMEGKLSSPDINLYAKFASGIPERIKKNGIGIGCGYINCWVMSEEELYLMWNTYSSLEEGIAIKSSIGKLIDSFDPSDPREVVISDIKYLDYENEYTFDKMEGRINALASYFCKRNYFSQEKELRLLYYDSKIKYHHNILGVKFNVSLESLIDEIYISPKAKKWFVDLIYEELKLHGINKRQRISRL